MLASFFILILSHSARIRPRSKASLQISASKCGKTLHNTNLPAECPAFLTALHQLTIKDYFKVSQARYTWNAYFGQTNKSIWGRGQRNDCSHRHWLKIHPNSHETSATNSKYLLAIFSIYIIFYNIRSCREPSKQFVQAPIAYKYIKIFFYWEAFEYLLRVLWFSERFEACRPSWIVT